MLRLDFTNWIKFNIRHILTTESANYDEWILIFYSRVWSCCLVQKRQITVHWYGLFWRCSIYSTRFCNAGPCYPIQQAFVICNLLQRSNLSQLINTLCLDKPGESFFMLPAYLAHISRIRAVCSIDFGVSSYSSSYFSCIDSLFRIMNLKLKMSQ